MTGNANIAPATNKQQHTADDLCAMFAGWTDGLSPGLTCEEAESVAAFLRAWGWDSTAVLFLEAHAKTDLEGDLHYPPDASGAGMGGDAETPEPAIDGWE